MEIHEALLYLNAVLELERKPVGVRFLYSEEEYKASPGYECEEKINYCQMVKRSSDGYCIKAAQGNFRCQSGPRAFGMTGTPDSIREGKGILNMGLYPDIKTVHSVYSRMSECCQKIYGILIMPIEQYDDIEPDVVVIVTNPYNAMRFVQGYTYSYGSCSHIEMFGNRAICSDATARPYIQDEMNITMLCSGTRYYCGWNKSELAIGIPYHKFIPTLEGILGSLNATEPIEDKKRIEARLKESGIKDFKVDMNKSYYHVWNK